MPVNFKIIFPKENSSLSKNLGRKGKFEGETIRVSPSFEIIKPL